MIEAVNSRFRHTLITAFAAVLVAAILRHTLHVYARISREDIRWQALLAVCALTIVVMIFRFCRRR
jgi:hypothetical protein